MKNLIINTLVCLFGMWINGIYVFCSDMIPIYSYNILGPSGSPKTDDSIKQCIRFVITTDKPVYGYCEPIVISATFENISEKNIMYFDSFNFWDNRPIVIKKGVLVPYTSYGTSIFSDFDKGLMDISGVVQHTLEPKQNITLKILINRIYDMSQHGKYQILLNRVAFDKELGVFCNISSCTQEIEISETYGKHPTIDYKPKSMENRPFQKDDQ